MPTASSKGALHQKSNVLYPDGLDLHLAGCMHDGGVSSLQQKPGLGLGAHSYSDGMSER